MTLATLAAELIERYDSLCDKDGIPDEPTYDALVLDVAYSVQVANPRARTLLLDTLFSVLDNYDGERAPLDAIETSALFTLHQVMQPAERQYKLAI